MIFRLDLSIRNQNGGKTWDINMDLKRENLMLNGIKMKNYMKGQQRLYKAKL